MTNLTRLELFRRLFLGLCVGFFCVTAALFLRDRSANQLPRVIAVSSGGASRASPGSAPKAASTPLQLDAAEKALIASSTSTLVTVIAVVVTNFLSWRRRKREAVKGTRCSRN